MMCVPIEGLWVSTETSLASFRENEEFIGRKLVLHKMKEELSKQDCDGQGPVGVRW